MHIEDIKDCNNFAYFFLTITTLSVQLLTLVIVLIYFKQIDAMLYSSLTVFTTKCCDFVASKVHFLTHKRMQQEKLHWSSQLKQVINDRGQRRGNTNSWKEFTGRGMWALSSYKLCYLDCSYFPTLSGCWSFSCAQLSNVMRIFHPSFFQDLSSRLPLFIRWKHFSSALLWSLNPHPFNIKLN